MVFEYACQLFPEDNQSVYIRKTARTLYTRGREHNKNYAKRETESFVKRHQEAKHSGMDPDFNAEVVYSFKASRQFAEGVAIRRCILNTKAGKHQPSLGCVRFTKYVTICIASI